MSIDVRQADLLTRVPFRFYTVENETEQEAIVHALVQNPENPAKLSPVDQVGEYFYKATRKQVEYASFTLVGGKSRAVDVVRHVLKVVPVIWAAQLVCLFVKVKCIVILDDVGWDQIEN